MYTPDLKRKRIAWLLLWIYTAMVMVVSVHRHQEAAAEAASICQECAHHVKHAGHLSAPLPTSDVCVLCQLQATPCLKPTTLLWTALTLAAVRVLCFVRSGYHQQSRGVISLRAPPYVVYI